jgi:hypothetical protein
MEVEAVPLTEFVHGSITAHEGHPLFIDEHTAAELERAGLVRIKLVPTGKKAEADAGKAPDDGAGPPSSASPAAQALSTPTLRASKPGGAKRHKSGT